MQRKLNNQSSPANQTAGHPDDTRLYIISYIANRTDFISIMYLPRFFHDEFLTFTLLLSSSKSVFAMLSFIYVRVLL